MSSSEKSPSGKQVVLNLHASDRLTEIRVLNARFEPVALSANTGSVTVNVPPGLYEVGFRQGKDWQSEHVLAGPDMSEVTVRQPPPISATLESVRATTRVAVSRSVPKAGATVVVSLTGTTSGLVDIRTAPKIAVSLSREDIAEQSAPDLAQGDWRDFQFAAEPGYWRLRINEPGERPPFELPLTISPGYRVEVVAPLSHSGNLSIDLERMRVRLLRLDEPDVMNAALTEFESAALGALGSGRPLYGPDFETLIDNLVDDKAHNPMLGILAAHLCDRGKGDDFPFQERLLDRLAALTGSPAIVNSDIAALRLRLLVRRGLSIDGEPPVEFPPLLAASWEALLDAARLRADLIPVGSLSERVAARLWSSSLWVAWSAAPPGAPSQPQPRPRSATAGTNFATVSTKIASALANPSLRDWLRDARRSSRSSTEGLAWDDMLDLTPAEAAVARALYPVAADEEKQNLLEGLAKRIQEHSSPIAGDLSAMCKVLGLPQTTVEQAADSLAAKLGSRAADFNIKLGE